jgi:hypothetical protein
MAIGPRTVAIACCREEADSPANVLYPDPDRAPLTSALERLGLTAAAVSWDDEAQPWGEYDLVLVRSTWDSVDRPDEYREWARRVEAVTRLANPRVALEWNLDKTHLLQLAEAGVAIPTTVFVRPGERWTPPAEEFVVKPTTSAAGRDTARYRTSELDAARQHVDGLHDRGATAMVQEYLTAVGERGEIKMTFLGGSYSHAVRVDSILHPGGGILERPWEVPTNPTVATPTDEELAMAEATMQRVGGCVDTGSPLLYGRIDLVAGRDSRPVLMEVELIDPALSLWAHDAAAHRLAAAIVTAIAG